MLLVSYCEQLVGPSNAQFNFNGQWWSLGQQLWEKLGECILWVDCKNRPKNKVVTAMDVITKLLLHDTLSMHWLINSFFPEFLSWARPSLNLNKSIVSGIIHRRKPKRKYQQYRNKIGKGKQIPMSLLIRAVSSGSTLFANLFSG